MEFMKRLYAAAKNNIKKIVLAEGNEERTLRAANIVLDEGLADIVLLGNESEIMLMAEKLNLSAIKKATIINPIHHSKIDEYTDLLYQIRKDKGLSIQAARQLITDPLYLACVMIKNGDADGEVAGARNSTGDVLRPAFQIIKTKPGINIVSGSMLVFLKNTSYGNNGLIIFSDCAVNPNPSAEELSQIAISTAETARSIAGFEPKIAMLSFSTKGSAKHEMADKVILATKLVKEKYPQLIIDGELQSDAAIEPFVAEKKAKGSPLEGRANVLIFPDLQSGNISYKLVQRLADAEAVGPVLQGMAAPINDLSRGCSVDDIVKMIVITASQAINKK